MYKCYFCNYEAKLKHHFIRHIKRKQKCSYVLKKTEINNIDDYNKYVNLHKKDPNNKIWYTEAELKDECKCQYCNKVFYQKQNLKVHFKTCERKKLDEWKKTLDNNNDNNNDNNINSDLDIISDIDMDSEIDSDVDSDVDSDMNSYESNNVVDIVSLILSQNVSNNVSNSISEENKKAKILKLETKRNKYEKKILEIDAKLEKLK